MGAVRRKGTAAQAGVPDHSLAIQSRASADLGPPSSCCMRLESRLPVAALPCFMRCSLTAPAGVFALPDFACHPPRCIPPLRLPAIWPQFHQLADGTYAARIHMTESSVTRADLHAAHGDDMDEHLVQQARRQAAEEASRRRAGSSGASAASSPSPRRAAARSAAPLSADDISHELARKGITLDVRPFGSFVAELSLRSVPKPRHRETPWCMRIIEEIYDERYKREQDLLAAEEAGEAPPDRESRPFPSSVVEYVKKRYGLPAIIEQSCIDILHNVTRMRRESADCDTFARFLEEYYDADELLFYLYVRSVAQKVLGNVSFRSMWSEVGRGPGSRAMPLACPQLDERQCSHIARIVFASERDGHFVAFKTVVDDHFATSGARTIDVAAFLQLALEEYHASAGDSEGDEDQDEDDDEGFADEEGEGKSRRRDVDTDRLVSQAARGYSDRRADAAGAGDGDDQDFDDEGEDGEEDDEHSAATRSLLERLSAALQMTNEDYIDRLLEAAASMPPEARDEVRQELMRALAQQVDALLMHAIEDTERGLVAVDETTNPIGARFHAVMSCASDSPDEDTVTDRIEALCNSIIESDDVRTAMEPTVAALVSFEASESHE